MSPNGGKADTAAALNNVRYWHKADMPIEFGNVCFWG